MFGLYPLNRPNAGGGFSGVSASSDTTKASLASPCVMLAPALEMDAGDLMRKAAQELEKGEKR